MLGILQKVTLFKSRVFLRRNISSIKFVASYILGFILDKNLGIKFKGVEFLPQTLIF